jgi:PAS domain S-box-containing protein
LTALSPLLEHNKNKSIGIKFYFSTKFLVCCLESISTFAANMDETPSQSQQTSNALPQVDLLRQLQHAEYQREELQAQVNALQERFRYVLSATQDAVWDWDLTKNTGWYSDGLKSLFGYDPNEISDAVKFWYDTIHPDDKDRVVAGIHAVIDNGGKHWGDRYRFKKGDGEYAWVFDRGYAIHDQLGKPIRMVGSMQDVTLEVQAKEALRESEEKFRGAFDQVAVGINIASPDGKLLAVNKAFPQFFGYTEEELKQKKITDLSHPDELEGDRKIISDLLSGRSQVAAREKRYIHKSGKVVWGRVYGTVVWDEHNKPKYIIGVLEDITSQHAAHEALKESEERLRLVIDAAKIGTWDFNPITGKLVWDVRCKAMFGLSADDHVDYEVFLRGIHPEDRAIADETNQNAIKGVGGGEYDLEYRTIGFRDQKLRWIRAKGRSYKDENGVAVRYAGTVIDITEEKQQQQQVREQEERFRVLATSIPQIVWTTDAEGIVDYISDKWQEYTGHVPNYEKFSFRRMIHPDDLERVIPEWNACMIKGIAYHGEYRLANVKTNEYRWYSCTTVPLFDEQGKPKKWIGSATDIHDQKVNEMILEEKVMERTKALKALNEKLEKSNGELEQYAYVTSHDLKEPLRKIRIYLSMLNATYAEQIPAEAIEYLSKIESASQRMSGLIDDLLKYSKLSSTATLLEEVDLDAIVHNLCSEFEYALKQKNISVEVRDLPVLRAIPVQMQQLFQNLFSNSIKFSKQNTVNKIKITCTLLAEAERAQTVGLKADAAYYKIIFEDEGIGFSEQHNEQIFTIFQRLHNRKEYEGHGIGLALCRKIVSNHQGIIWARGEENKGASFTIILPIEQQ